MTEPDKSCACHDARVLDIPYQRHWSLTRWLQSGDGIENHVGYTTIPCPFCAPGPLLAWRADRRADAAAALDKGDWYQSMLPNTLHPISTEFPDRHDPDQIRWLNQLLDLKEAQLRK